MIFTILVSLAGIVTVAATLYAALDEGIDGIIGVGIPVGVVSALAAAVVFFGGFNWWMQPELEQTKQTTYELAALSTGEQLDGRSYFLGGGYLGGERVLNYIRATDPAGGFQLKSIPAERAVIFERADEPTVTIHEYEARNPWLAPWAWSETTLATFNVPEGSVLSDYTVGNSGDAS